MLLLAWWWRENSSRSLLIRRNGWMLLKSNKKSAICMCIYMFTLKHMQVYMFTLKYMHVYICLFWNPCMFMYALKYIYVYLFTCEWMCPCLYYQLCMFRSRKCFAISSKRKRKGVLWSTGKLGIHINKINRETIAFRCHIL